MFGVDLKGKMCSKQSFHEGENEVEGGGASEVSFAPMQASFP